MKKLCNKIKYAFYIMVLLLLCLTVDKGNVRAIEADTDTKTTTELTTETTTETTTEATTESVEKGTAKTEYEIKSGYGLHHLKLRLR